MSTDGAEVVYCGCTTGSNFVLKHLLGSTVFNRWVLSISFCSSVLKAARLWTMLATLFLFGYSHWISVREREERESMQWGRCCHSTSLAPTIRVSAVLIQFWFDSIVLDADPKQGVECFISIAFPNRCGCSSSRTVGMKKQLPLLRANGIVFRWLLKDIRFEVSSAVSLISSRSGEPNELPSTGCIVYSFIHLITASLRITDMFDGCSMIEQFNVRSECHILMSISCILAALDWISDAFH